MNISTEMTTIACKKSPNDEEKYKKSVKEQEAAFRAER